MFASRMVLNFRNAVHDMDFFLFAIRVFIEIFSISEFAPLVESMSDKCCALGNCKRYANAASPKFSDVFVCNTDLGHKNSHISAVCARIYVYTAYSQISFHKHIPFDVSVTSYINE